MLAARAGAARASPRRSGRSPTRRSSSAANGKAISTGGAPNLAFSVDPTATSASTRSTLTAGALARTARTRSRSTQHIAKQEALQGRRHDRHRGPRPGEQYRIAGIVEVRRRLVDRRRDARRLRHPDRAEAVPQGGQARRGPRRREAGRLGESCVARDQAGPAGERPGPDAARSRSRKTRRTLRRSSTSSRTSCWRSPASRSSSAAFVIANTLSITIAQRMREFATLRTLGATRRQVLGSVRRRGARDRHPRLARRASSSGSASRRALECALRRASGVDLPKSGTVFATRTVIVSLVVGDPGHVDRQPAAGAARDARAADRRRARGRGPAARRASRASGRRSRDRGVVARHRARARLGALRPRPLDGATLLALGVGVARCVFIGVAIYASTARAAAGPAARLARHGDRRRRRASSRATTRCGTRSARRRPRPR